MIRSKMGIESFLGKLKTREINRIKIGMSDIDGIVRGKVLHGEKAYKLLQSSTNTFAFCSVVFGWDIQDKSYMNTKSIGLHTGYPDLEVQLDLKTLRFIPWDDNTPFFLGNLSLNNPDKLGELCPRNALIKVIKKSTDLGYYPYFGQEFEWFNFDQTPQGLADSQYNPPTPISPGMFGYSLMRSTHKKDFFNQLFCDMDAFDVPLEGLHTETGPGVYEAAITYSDILSAADRAILFKMGAKEIGIFHKIMPSFMAKWNSQLPGCSGHIHQSLWDKEKTRNYFLDEKLKSHYLAGMLMGLKEFLPFFAPTINSYKRFVRGTWAPTKANWGYDNRTVAIRDLTKGINANAAARLEFRIPGSDVNPYVAMAANLALGIYGIENELSLKNDPVVGNGYLDMQGEDLPSTLPLALEKLEQSQLARDLLGDTFVEHFIQTRKWEIEQFNSAITNWEFERYFEGV